MFLCSSKTQFNSFSVRQYDIIQPTKRADIHSARFLYRYRQNKSSIVRFCDEILALSGQISIDKAKMIANEVASSVPKTIDEATLLNYYCSFKLCLLPHYPLVGAVCSIYF